MMEQVNGHWCEACDCYHTSMSCYHPAGTKIKALRAEVMEQCRLNGMGAEREARLRGRIAELEAENEALRQGATDNRMWAQQAITDMQAADALLDKIAQWIDDFLPPGFTDGHVIEHDLKAIRAKRERSNG